MERRKQIRHLVRVLRTDSAAVTRQGHRAVNGAGINIEKTQCLGGLARQGALSGPRGSVNGDADLFHEMLSSSFPSSQMSCGPGNLQIKAAGIGIHIYNFTGKIEPGALLGLHGGGIDLRNFNPTAGDNGLLYRPRAGDRDIKAFDRLQQSAALSLSNIMHFGFRRNAGALHYQRYHQPGQQRAQGVGKAPVMVLLKVPQNALVQLLLIQRGF